MNIEYATTDDMLEELHRRNVRFVYAGLPNSNLDRREIHFACQGESREEILDLIRNLYLRVKTPSDIDAIE